MDTDQLLERIDSRADDALAFCASLVRLASPNPPGDTRAVADAVRARLERDGHAIELIADQDHTPNLVATAAGSRPGRRLALVGHMDVYPDGEQALWSRPPRSGAIADGRLHGRGAGDMKSGLTALIEAFCALAAAPDLAGTVSLLAVSDEMSFSPHGAPLVLERRPELAADGAIGTEPTSPDFVLIGEKGMLWLEVACSGDGGAGAFATVEVTNAIEALAAVLGDLGQLRRRVALPAAIAAALRDGGGTAGLPEEALTYADDRVLDLVTVNVGRIGGGRKINLVADACAAEVDIRLPPGVSLAEVTADLDAILARHPRATYHVIQAMEPNHTDTSDPLVVAMLDAGERVLGVRPRPELGITASDTRLFRALGRPAAMIGPRIAGQGLPDESIAAADLLAVTKVVALAAARFLAT